MKIGDKINYFGKEVEVVEFNKTHVLIEFDDGSKICTNKLAIKECDFIFCHKLEYKYQNYKCEKQCDVCKPNTII